MDIVVLNDGKRIVALDPDYCMRREGDRVCIFSRNPFARPVENTRLMISSPEAVLLALCDGRRTLDSVVEYASCIINIEENTARTIVLNCLKKYREYLVEVDNGNCALITRYRPEDFILFKNGGATTASSFSAPELVMLIPTFSCGCRCRYCYAPRHLSSLEMGMDTMDSLLAQMKAMEIPSAIFSGGDPFCHAQIMEIVNKCVERQIKPILATKTPLSMAVIADLESSGIREIQVSIDSSDRDIVEYLVGKTDYFDRLITSIKNLVARSIKVNINTVLTACNIGTIERTVRDFAEMGVEQVTLSQYSRSRYCHDDALFCRPDEIDDLETRIPVLKNSLRSGRLFFKKVKDPAFMSMNEKKEFYRDRPVCNAGRNGLVVLPDGLVTVCEVLYYTREFILGDIKYDKLADIWNSEQRTGFVSKGYSYLAGEECRRCDELVQCYTGRGKCFVRALQAHGDALEPDPFCPKSPAGRRFT